MGITGTDVTKNVADMVLADDNFATIVSAVGEGTSNLRQHPQGNSVPLASNLSEVLAIFIATLIGFTILQPVHLLWINLITDCFPALALGVEQSEKDIMKRPPGIRRMAYLPAALVSISHSRVSSSPSSRWPPISSVTIWKPVSGNL